MDLAALCLLILGHYLRHLLDRVRTLREEAAVAQVDRQRALSFGRSLHIPAEHTVRKLCRHDQPHRNRLSVRYVTILALGQGLYRMGEGMTQIQLATLALLELVARNDARLHTHRLRNQVHQLARIRRHAY